MSMTTVLKKFVMGGAKIFCLVIMKWPCKKAIYL